MIRFHMPDDAVLRTAISTTCFDWHQDPSWISVVASVYKNDRAQLVPGHMQPASASFARAVRLHDSSGDARRIAFEAELGNRTRVPAFVECHGDGIFRLRPYAPRRRRHRHGTPPRWPFACFFFFFIFFFPSFFSSSFSILTTSSQRIRSFTSCSRSRCSAKQPNLAVIFLLFFPPPLSVHYRFAEYHLRRTAQRQPAGGYCVRFLACSHFLSFLSHRSPRPLPPPIWDWGHRTQAPARLPTVSAHLASPDGDSYLVVGSFYVSLAL